MQEASAVINSTETLYNPSLVPKAGNEYETNTFASNNAKTCWLHWLKHQHAKCQPTRYLSWAA